MSTHSLHVQGLCKTCGRHVHGFLLREDTTLAEDACPRCGARPFFIDAARIYVDDIRKMPIDDAIAFCETCEYQDEVEAILRVEIWGPNRYEVIKTLLQMYEFLDFGYHIDSLSMKERIVKTSTSRKPGFVAHSTQPTYKTNIILTPNLY